MFGYSNMKPIWMPKQYLDLFAKPFEGQKDLGAELSRAVGILRQVADDTSSAQVKCRQQFETSVALQV